MRIGLLAASFVFLMSPDQRVVVDEFAGVPTFEVQYISAMCGHLSPGSAAALRVERQHDNATMWEVRAPSGAEKLRNPVVYGVLPTSWETIIEAQPLVAEVGYRVEVEGGGPGSALDDTQADFVAP